MFQYKLIPQSKHTKINSHPFMNFPSFSISVNNYTYITFQPYIPSSLYYCAEKRHTIRHNIGQVRADFHHYTENDTTIKIKFLGGFTHMT